MIGNQGLSDLDWQRYKENQRQERFRDDIRYHDRITEGAITALSIWVIVELYKLVRFFVKLPFKILWWLVVKIYRSL